MFLSIPEYEFQMPEGLATPGSRHWRVVEMALHAPWYLLTIEQPEPGTGHGLATHTLCIAWETDLADAIKAVEATYVRGLVAMIPAWASPTGQWTSRQINEVWLENNETGKFVTLLDVAGNQVDAGIPMERSSTGPRGELLLRLDDKAPMLRPRTPGSGRVRRRSPRAA